MNKDTPSYHTIKHGTRISVGMVMQEEIKVIQTKKEETKLSLSSNDMIVFKKKKTFPQIYRLLEAWI